MELVRTVAIAVWVMLPAYLPNNAAVLAGGGRAIDGGRTWHGRRLLGDGKTWRGTVAGIVAGVLAAIGLNLLIPTMQGVTGIVMPRFPTGIVIAFPAGALAGDMLASFLKRRSGRARGAPMPLLDQLDFVVMALLFGALVDLGWMTTVFSARLIGTVVVLTILFHLGTNGVAYLLGLKDEPW